MKVEIRKPGRQKRRWGGKGSSKWLPNWNRHLKVFCMFEDIFNVFAHHFWDVFFWFVRLYSGVFLKLIHLCKWAPRPHGSIVLVVSAPCFLMICWCFRVIPHVSFRFNLGSILETILASFGFYVCVWNVINMSPTIDATIGIEKGSFRAHPGTK